MPDDPIFSSKPGMERLLQIMQRLRDPETGCPWDIEQTLQTIAPYTIEEAYEVADAIDRLAFEDLRSELGDLLLQVVYHTAITKEMGQFSFQDVAESISQKMIDRHPHVFGSENRDKSAEQQTKDWEEIKALERSKRAETGVLDGIAQNLPALLRAVKLQNRAARVGFDWPDAAHVLDKIEEECRELVEAQTQEHVFEEFGDLLFVIANLARHLKIDPEAALRAANAKFTRRFNDVECKLAKLGKTPQQSDLAQMDALWDEVKREERQS